jgi:hypothetical protein
VIGGSAGAAILVAFLLARMVRGSGAERAAAPPSIVRATPAKPTDGSRRPALPPPVAAHAGSAHNAAADPPPGAVVQAADALASDDDGEAVAGGTPVAGSGPCRFTVATTPAGSIVRLDELAMGPSPLTIEGTCEKHKIDVSHARYQGVTRWVTLAADKPQELDINLPRPIHAVTVTSFPPGAELSIDGHRAGTTPTIVQMMGFATVNLTFTKSGFQSATKKVYSKLPQDRVFVKLTK